MSHNVIPRFLHYMKDWLVFRTVYTIVYKNR